MTDNVVRTGEYGSEDELVAYAGLKSAWHTPTGVFGSFENWTDALNKAHLAGLNYELLKRHIPTRDGVEIEGYEDEFDIIRGPLPELGITTSRKTGTVKTGYEIVQPFDLAAILDEIATPDKWGVETTGLLGDGDRIWGLLNIPEGHYWVGNYEREEYKAHLLFIDHYNGRRGLTFKTVKTRVVCQNTEQAALQEDGLTLSLAHSQSPNLKVQFIASLQAAAIRNIEKAREQAAAMLNTKITEEEIRELFEAAFPMPKRKGEDHFFAKAINSPDALKLPEDVFEAARLGAEQAVMNINNDVRRQMERRDAAMTAHAAFNDEQPYAANTAYSAYQAVTNVTTWMTEGTRGDRVNQLLDTNSWRNRAQSFALTAAMNYAKAAK